MNAVTLEILINRYYDPELYRGGSQNLSQTQLEGFEFLKSHKLLGEDLKITDKGRIHVKALLEMPFPKQEWVSPIKHLHVPEGEK